MDLEDGPVLGAEARDALLLREPVREPRPMSPQPVGFVLLWLDPNLLNTTPDDDIIVPRVVRLGPFATPDDDNIDPNIVDPGPFVTPDDDNIDPTIVDPGPFATPDDDLDINPTIVPLAPENDFHHLLLHVG